MINRKNSAEGFTLIELMITVAIVAILAAIAYPSYKEQVARGRRGDAQAALLETAQWIERQYTISNAYDKIGVGAASTAMNDAALPALKSRTADVYAVSFGTTTAASAPWAAGFTLRMVPSGSMANDRCGTFVLENTGKKYVSGAAGVPACWDR
jgi:type IV pilus assembly protein PilE